MIPLDEARRAVFDGCPLLPVEEVELLDALDLVLVDDVIAGDPVPPFANSAMDGFAVRAADTASAPVSLRVVATIAAGDDPTTSIGPGRAARIMTGAPLPPGADAVVMVEQTHPDPDAGDNDTVVIEASAAPGQFVRGAGDDLRPGQVVFAAGTVLGPGHLGVLATVGAATVRVRRRPVVGVLSTGDELVEPGVPLGPGQIRDANRPALLALVAEAGFIPVDLGSAADTEAATTEGIDAGLASCDAILTSGGVSMGEFDYVKRYLDTWMQVAIKPAKPFAFGVVDGTPIFGLPGNPVSSMVSFELFARPAIRRMLGHPAPDRTTVDAVADEALTRRADGKLHFVRVVLTWRDGAFHVRSAGGQGSHQLSAMATATGLAMLPDGTGVDVGDTCAVLDMRGGRG